jgi:uncharacterized membrane protein
VDTFLLPNFHAIIIHFPIAMLGIGVAIELFSFLWRRSSFRLAGQWMILIGTLAIVPAVTTGLSALQTVMAHAHGADSGSWVDLKAGSGFTQTDWNFIRLHIILNACAAGLVLLAVVTWLASSDTWRNLLRIPALLMLIAAMGLMVDGAWHGGEMVYRLGFAVQGKLGTVAEPVTPPSGLEEKMDYYAPRMDVHLLMAGVVFSLAAVTLGLSVRRAVTTDTVLVQRVPPTYVPAASEKDNIKPISLMQALNDPGDEIPVVPAIPAARFWLLTALIVICTVVTGLWLGDYFTSWPMIINKDHVVSAIKHILDPNKAREGLHIIFGSSILILTLVLALITRFAPRSRVILSGFSLLLVLAMAGQIWLGILLTFDGGRGPKTRFRTEAEAAAPETEEPTTAPATQPSMSKPPATQPMTWAQ